MDAMYLFFAFVGLIVLFAIATKKIFLKYEQEKEKS
jgi:hypothetical protein